MVAESDVPDIGAWLRVSLDGMVRVVQVVATSETSIVVKVPNERGRTLKYDDILGPAEDPFGEELAAVVPAEATFPGVVRLPLTLESLSADESEALEHLETRASQAFDTIRESGFEAGQALHDINEGRLYRSTHATFEDYCRERWEIGRAQAYSLMDFAKVRGTLSARADIQALPETAKQVRELKYAGELAPEAWLLAVERKGGEQPTSREVAQAADETVHDYQGREVDDEVWWIEADTQHLRAGRIERLWRGEAVIYPTDGGGPKQAFPLALDRLGKGEIPGPPTPFGECGEYLGGGISCGEPALAAKGQCQRHKAIDDLQAQAQEQAGTQGHQLAGWETNGQSSFILGAKCKACGGGVSLFGNENPPNMSLSPKLKTRCVGVGIADGRVNPETAPVEDAEQVAKIREALKSLPAGEVLGVYSRLRRSDALGSEVRVQLCRTDLDRRRNAGIDLPWCNTHGDYSPCLECERAAIRVEELAETAGMPEIAGELKTAAGIQPPVSAPDPTPPAQLLQLEPPAPAAETPRVSPEVTAANVALEVRPGAPDGAPVIVCPITSDVVAWVKSSGLNVKDFLFRLKVAAWDKGTDATGILAQLEA